MRKVVSARSPKILSIVGDGPRIVRRHQRLEAGLSSYQCILSLQRNTMVSFEVLECFDGVCQIHLKVGLYIPAQLTANDVQA